MKINILDDGLREKAGHHFDFDSKLLGYLARAGHDVHVYGYAGMQDDVVEELRPHGAVTRLFRRFHYDRMVPLDPFAGALDAFQRKCESVAEDLRSVEAADLWIWPTLRGYNLHACTQAGIGAPVVGCIHQDPGIAVGSMSARLWRVAFLAAERQGLRFTVGSIEPELCRRFAPLVPPGRLIAIPQPFEGPPIAQPKAALARIGFFGKQRKEKGVELMAPLFERLIGDGYAITLQNSHKDYPLPTPPQIELLEFVEDFPATVAACDLVVLPYDPQEYARKGSGILAQCLALGIPVIGPAGTLPGALIEQHGLGPLFPAPTVEAIYGAIRRAGQNYPAFADNAWRAAHEFAKRNGVARFAEAFLAAAQ